MPSQPMFQPQPYYAQPQQRASQPVRQASRNDRYLPPMPEMLRPVQESAPATPRYAQQTPKSSPERQEGKNLLVRGQAPEEPANAGVKAKLMMPSPEELGIGAGAGAASPSADDWGVARRELDTLGATSYRLEKAPEGGFRFHCAFAHTGEPSRQRNFESQAATESEAIRLALRQVEAWRAAQK